MYAVRRHLATAGRVMREDLYGLSAGRIATDLLLLFVALQALVLFANAIDNRRPILGLRFEGKIVGYLGDKDFRNQADAIIYAHENANLAVSAADHKSTVSLRQLGVATNTHAVHNELVSFGRTGTLWQRFADQNLALMGEVNINLKNDAFNESIAKEYVDGINKKIAIAPQNAYFAYKDAAVYIHPEVTGRAIPLDEAIALLRTADPQQDPHITLPTRQETAPVRQVSLRPLLPEVQAIAAKPLTIIAGSSHVTVPPEQLVTLVIPKISPNPKNPQQPSVQLTYDEAKLNALVDDVVSKGAVAPQPTIMSGGYIVRQGKSGLRAADSQNTARVLAALMQRQARAATPEEVHIPLIEVSPPVQQQAVAAPGPVSQSGTGRVSLTFDDGPGGYTEQVLDILKRYNVHATFYVIGRNVQRYPGTMQRIASEGHRIGNHTFNHPNLTTLSSGGVHQELSATQAAIREACGVTPTLFRPPYGAQNGTVRQVAASLGLSTNLWSVDTNDWAQPGSSAIAQRAIAGARQGSVILLHSVYQQTANALPAIIEGIRANGYTLD